MNERPILFSGPMVRAILDGTKTQTRRVMKPQPERCPVDYPRPGHWWPSRNHQSMLHVEDELQNLSGGWSGLAASACPYGEDRDRLWVRECFAAWWTTATGTRSHVMGYRADINDPDWDGFGADDPWWLDAKWEPSIHMPRAFSRITLEITDVRVQRLHDISHDDILAEGIRVPTTEDGHALIDVSTKDGPAAFLDRETIRDPKAILRAHWAALWCSINGRASWDANPWVWALTFQRVMP